MSAVRPLMKIASSPSSAPMLMDTCMPPHRLGAQEHERPARLSLNEVYAPHQPSLPGAFS